MDDLILFLESPSGIGGMSVGVFLFICVVFYGIVRKYQNKKDEERQREERNAKQRERYRIKKEAEVTAKMNLNVTINNKTNESK